MNRQPWNIYVRKFRTENPNLSYRNAVAQASILYKAALPPAPIAIREVPKWLDFYREYKINNPEIVKPYKSAQTALRTLREVIRVRNERRAEEIHEREELQAKEEQEQLRNFNVHVEVVRNNNENKHGKNRDLRKETKAEIEILRGRQFKKAVNTYKLSTIQQLDALKHYKTITYDAIKIMKKEIDLKKSYKVRFITNIKIVEKIVEKSRVIPLEYKAGIFGKTFECLNKNGISNLYRNIQHDMLEKIEGMVINGSRKCEAYVINTYIAFYKYRPYRGGSYLPLPEFIKKKQCCINVLNKDNLCFKYALLCALHHEKLHHPERVSSYANYMNQLNFGNLQFPMKIKDITKFEELNPGMSICVMAYDVENKCYPIRRHSNYDADIKIPLLFYGDKVNNHYCFIKSLSRMFCYDHNKTFVCENCITTYQTSAALENHKKNRLCDGNSEALIKLPKEDDAYIRFKAIKKQLKSPFVIYADFESIITEDKKHSVCSYGYKIISCYSEYNNYPFVMYRGTDAIVNFLKSIYAIKDELLNIVFANNDMIITNEQENEFKNATHCHICSQEFDAFDEIVRDHDHITGLYRGPAHQECNINYNYKGWKIPVFFHNLRGYDSHFIISECYKVSDKISVIANTEEKYISFTLDCFKFMDSYQHLSASLESLAISMPKDKIANFDKEFQNLTREQYALLTRKGVYPYSYMSSFEKFDESFPEHRYFYNDLALSNISKDEYNHARKVYDTLECKNMGDYHDIYLKCDVMLLCDVFENYREISMKMYKLDPANYYTSPSLSFDALLRKTNKSIGLFNENQYDMLLMFEKMKRGGVCMISKRYAEANNKYMSTYDTSKSSKYLLYLDANNLYGWAMSQALPIRDFKWDDANIFTSDYIMSLKDDSERGYIINCDLKYPQELHDNHNCYPLAPESIQGEYSEFFKGVMKADDLKADTTKKLIPNLYDKKDYVCHYRLLKFYLSQGLILEKVNSVISFVQGAWMKSYIDMNTTERAKAKYDNEKDFYKLMNNSVFGKTIENVRKRSDIKLCTDERTLLKHTSRPNFKGATVIVDDELISVNMRKANIEFDKPIHAGVCILDLSKLLMYEFHYNTMRAKYGDKCQLLMTDTDSLFYEIESEDVYDDLKNITHLFDFSGYDKQHSLFSNDNKKVIGKFKDEADGHILTEFVGLRPKCYSFWLDDKNKKRGKGISMSYMREFITHQNYKNCLFGTEKCDRVQHCSFYTIKSELHQVKTHIVNKTSLTMLDNKRYVQSDNIHTMAIGHYKNKL